MCCKIKPIKPLTVDAAIRASNATLMNGGGKRITVPANDRVEIRFDAAADKAGTARFQIGAVSGSLTDAAQVEIPVWTPATSEAFATYGTTDANGAIVQPIDRAKGCLFGIRRFGIDDEFDAVAGID